jgi:hypothetical protein
MLTHNFYRYLAMCIKGDASEQASLSMAIGTGSPTWDLNPPLLRRSIATLTTEVARKPIVQSDIQYLSKPGEVSVEATALIAVASNFLAGEGVGSIRECGIYSGVGEYARLIAYFVHPPLEKRASSRLKRNVQLTLTPDRVIAQEIPTRYLGNSNSEEFHDLENEKTHVSSIIFELIDGIILNL